MNGTRNWHVHKPPRLQEKPLIPRHEGHGFATI
jgi:hypothetical protein